MVFVSVVYAVQVADPRENYELSHHSQRDNVESVHHWPDIKPNLIVVILHNEEDSRRTRCYLDYEGNQNFALAQLLPKYLRAFARKFVQELNFVVSEVH